MLPLSKARLGAIQFQTEPKEICPLTSDPLEFSTFVSSFIRVSGGTNASKAIQLCLDNLASPSSAGRAGCVVLMTDGDVNDCVKFQSVMIEKRINFLILAYVSPRNEASRQALQELTLKARNLIFLADFAEVRAVFSRILVQPQAPPELLSKSRGISRLQLTVVPPPDVAESGEPDWLQIQILSNQTNSWIPGGVSQIRDFSMEKLLADTLYTFQARLRLPGGNFTAW